MQFKKWILMFILGIWSVHTMAMHLKSSAFSHEGSMPTKYTCQGNDTSPPLSWSGIPAGTKSLVLIMDDPDAPDPAAPKMTWDHWILYNMSPTSTGLPEQVTAKDLPPGTMQAKNSWDHTGYGGPCPPIGRHRYFFKLYALNDTLPDLNSPNKTALEHAMKGKIIEQATMIGTYQKN